MDLSIIIVNWNAKELTKQCLNSIYKNTSGITFEIFVVDEGSTDGSGEMIKNEFPKVTLIQHTQKIGFSKSNNEAIRLSKGRYILLLGSDTIIVNNALGKMVRYMDLHKECGGLNPRIVNPNRTFQSIGGAEPPTFITTLMLYFLPLEVYRRLRRHNTTQGKKALGEGVEVKGLSGAVMLIRRETIEKVGLLDEQLPLFCEDVDFAYRIKKGGWKLCCIPGVSVVHIGGGSSALAPIETGILARKAKLALLKKYGKLSQAFVLKKFLCLASIMRIFAWSIIYLFSQKKRTLAKNNIIVYKSIFKWALFDSI